jgi:cytochrome c-type biogenesis protein CcmF
MSDFGTFLLYFAHALCLWGIVVSVVAINKNDLRAFRSAERSLIALFVLNLFSVSVLIASFLKDDFTIKYVYEYSRRAQPLVYKISALWGGMEGSLLLWEFFLSLYCVAALYLFRKKIFSLLPFASLIFFIVQGFFLFLLSFKTNPFAPLADAEGNIVSLKMAALIDGIGMNPLLQNVYMAIHPPLLYLGFVGFTIPFAYLISVVFAKEKKPLYLIPLRHWTLFSWLALGMGIIFGSYWAYLELGWGGYWGWDPVENASLIPWLTATAFLHTLFLERKRGLFKTTNYILATLTFLLSIYATYLTRSGVLQSVHSFGSEGAGVPFFLQLGTIFLGFMLMIIILSSVAAFYRYEVIKSFGKIKSSFSREAMVLYGTLLFALFAFIVFYGVTSPIFYRIFIGRELHNGVDFYNPKAVPISLALLLVMSIAATAPWVKGTLKEVKKNLLFPMAVGALSLLAGFLYLYSKKMWFSEVSQEKKILFYFLLLFFIAGFFMAAAVSDYFRAVNRIKKKTNKAVASFFLAILENPKRYGAYLAHLGIIVFCIGVAFSSVFQKSYSEILSEGEAFKTDGTVFSFSKLESDDFNQDIRNINQLKIWAEVDLFKDSKYIGTLLPKRVHYKSTLETNQPPSYEVAIKSTLFQDYYIILGGFDLVARKASLTLYVNPFVAFLWLGGLLLLLGGVVAFLPLKRVI